MWDFEILEKWTNCIRPLNMIFVLICNFAIVFNKWKTSTCFDLNVYLNFSVMSHKQRQFITWEYQNIVLAFLLYFFFYYSCHWYCRGCIWDVFSRFVSYYTISEAHLPSTCAYLRTTYSRNLCVKSKREQNSFVSVEESACSFFSNP